MKNDLLQKHNIFTIPNAMSLFRVLLIPVMVWLYLWKENGIATVGLLALSGLTDILDGRIARKYGMVSDLGKILDPIADKLTQGIVIICLILRYPWMSIVTAFFILKEALMIFMGCRAIQDTNQVSSAKWFGKANTVILYLVMMALILFPGMPEGLSMALGAVSLVSMLTSLVLYIRYYHLLLRRTDQV